MNFVNDLNIHHIQCLLSRYTSYTYTLTYMGHTLGFLSFTHNLRKQYLLGLKCLHTSIIIFIIITYCNIISTVSLINSSPILVELHETIVSAHNAANFFVPIGREKALMIPIFCTCLAVTLILILEQLTNQSLLKKKGGSMVQGHVF